MTVDPYNGAASTTTCIVYTMIAVEYYRSKWDKAMARIGFVSSGILLLHQLLSAQHSTASVLFILGANV